MAKTTVRGRVMEALQSRERRTRYLQIFLVVALVVAGGVALYLRQRGMAMVHEVTVLDCPYDGNGAHTHDSSCYDDEGNLVCLLEERELHVHDDSCYTVERVLVCGQEESEGHTHTEECYDEEGNLICELEESEGHQHTDECYETIRTLTCEKEEITEEHVHGPGCFKTILVPDDEAEEEAVSEAPATSGEQTLTYNLKEYDAYGSEQTVASVAVKAPAGTLPVGATAKLERLDSARSEDALREAERIIDDELGGSAVIGRASVVRVVLLNDAGEKTTPSGTVQVKLWTDFTRDADGLVLVRVPDADDPSPEHAAPVRDVALVNWDDNDWSSGSEDTLRFWDDLATDSLVVAEVVVPEATDDAEPELIATNDATSEQQENKQPDAERLIETTVELAPTEQATNEAKPEASEPTYPAQRFVGRAGDITVSVSAPEGAFPAGTTMHVDVIDTEDVKDAVSGAVSGMVEAVAAVDITFRDATGTEVQPLVPIEVNMVNNGDAQDGQPIVLHVDDEGEATVVMQSAITTSSDEVTFDSDAFSIYVLAQPCSLSEES